MGFNAEKYTKGAFLKGADLEEGERLIVTIKSAEEVEMPSGDLVPVIELLEISEKLTLNKTRIRKLVELFGPDSDAWINRQVALYPVPVQFNGKSQMGVAIAGVAKKSKVATQAASPKNDVQFMDDDDDTNPF